MKKPKWQRARVIKQKSGRREHVGKLLWVTCGSPQATVESMSIDTGEIRIVTDALETNLIGPVARIVFSSSYLELLARGPEDFADNVPLIPLDQWLKESTPEKSA